MGAWGSRGDKRGLGGIGGRVIKCPVYPGHVIFCCIVSWTGGSKFDRGIPDRFQVERGSWAEMDKDHWSKICKA